MIKLNGTIKNNEEVINTLKELAGVDLINGEFKAQINHNQREKLISNRAISKSENNGFSRQEHLIAVANIDKLFKGARFLGRFDDIKHGQKDIKILRFENYCIFENKIAKCLITAKETKNTFTDTETRLPNVESTPSAKAISVAIGIPKPCSDAVPPLSAK